MPDPILTRARELIADPANWARDYYARDGEGFPTGLEEPGAKCFCILGAVNRAIAEKVGLDKVRETLCPVSFLERTEDFNRVHRKLCAAMSFDGGIADFNDDGNTTHADVLALIDKANA